MKRYAWCSLLLLGSTLVALAAACDDDVTQTESPSTIDASTPPSDAGTTAPVQDALAPETGVSTVTTFAVLDPSAGQLPESILLRNNEVYAGTISGQILRLSYPDPSAGPVVYASIAQTPANFLLGFDFDAAGQLYVAVATADPSNAASVAVAGIYKIPAGGGTAVLWASGATFTYPTSLAFDEAGNLFVSDPREGAIFRIPPAGAIGTATVWKKDVLLSNDSSTCAEPSFFPGLAVNGIVVDREGVWAANSTRASLVRIPIGVGGGAGAAAIVAQDCLTLQGIDGLRSDLRQPTSGFLAANNQRNSIVAITRTGQVSVLASGKPPFYTPTDLAVVPGSGSREVIVGNGSFFEALAPADAGLVPRPGLLKLILP